MQIDTFNDDLGKESQAGHVKLNLVKSDERNI